MAPMANTAPAVEKMEVDEPAKPAEEKEPPKDLNAIALENIKEHCTVLDKGDIHSVARVLQVLPKTRKQCNVEVLHRLITNQIPSPSLHKDALLAWIPCSVSVAMEVDTKLAPAPAPGSSAIKSPRPARKPAGASPESELYIHLLVLLYLLDQNRLDDAKKCAEMLISRADSIDKRSLDPLVAKGIFYLALIYERQHKLHELGCFLNSRLRTATLRRQRESQAVLIYTLLRCYLINKQFQSAAKLVSKVTFPEGANNNDLARFLYYQGRIKALQLDYIAAAGYFLQAMRKAPQEAAIGFKQNVQKWIIVIGLLQGEIAERSIFRQPIYRKCLHPYLELTQAVRLGDLAKFNAVVKHHAPEFENDETLTLIVRLRQNVIKTAVKQISLAYSRITIEDIAKKLGMNNESETEYLVAKAIADGAIDAVISCDSRDGKRFMRSSETVNVYSTTEPQTHFDSRIRYCLELHNQAVKALRYPPKNKCDVESIEAQREREQQTRTGQAHCAVTFAFRNWNSLKRWRTKTMRISKHAMLRMWQRVQHALDAAMGLGSRFPPIVPAVAMAGCEPSAKAPGSSYGIQELINDMRTLLGVPKHRTSKPRKVTRKFSFTRLLKPTTDLVTCPSCGSIHHSDTICGTCYEKIHQLTNEIKRKMMSYNPYKGERQDKQVFVKFANDNIDDGVLNGKRIIEMEKERPTWFKKLF
ncbi:ribosomal protein L32 [Oesophagostomum dentatum]|uniref:Ribosomal protein L32 n=1 Tax=Oesophagostomum dentatum TaxID=61180 RepID=A0A0B1SKX5_OESDE|nr:ribosomal protein L32 [Oesophagostomum dentatum]